MSNFFGVPTPPDRQNQYPVERTKEACSPASSPTDNKIRGINIQQLNRGYIVAVGCHNFAFESVESVIEKVSEYLREPADTEKRWFEQNLF